MPFPIIPLSELSFAGPLVRTGSGVRHHYLSLMHWFESEKYWLSAPELAQSCMDSHTLKMLSKVSRRNSSLWRGDWTAVRGRVMLAGMTYARWADPSQERWSNERLIGELTELGFPPRFSEIAFREFQNMLAQPEIVLLGVDHAPPDVVGRRLNALHRKFKRQWTVAFWLGRHVEWRLYDWLRSQHVPVRLAGDIHQRLTDAALRELVDGRQVVLFEQKGAKRHEALVRQLKSWAIPYEIDYFVLTGSGNPLSLIEG